MNELEQIKAPKEYLPEDQMKELSLSLQDAKIKSASIRVVNDETMDEANALCGTMRAKQKSIENFRIAIVKPFKDHIANIDKFFKDLAAGFNEPMEIASDKVLKYRERKIEAERKERERLEKEAHEKEEKEREKIRIQHEEAKKKEEAARAAGREAEAERQAAEAARLKKAESEVAIAITPKKEAPKKSTFQEGVGRTTFVKDAEYRIENSDLLPDEFWVIDEKKINARVREVKKDLEVGKVYRDRIPGVVITCIERASYTGEKQ